MGTGFAEGRCTAGRAVLWVMLAGSFLGCDAGEGAGAAKEPPIRTIESNGGTYTVKFQPTHGPVALNVPFDLRFWVEPHPPAVGPGVDLHVEVDARMPAHFHGMNRVPKVSRQADGSYRAEGFQLHMPGHWELYFDLEQGGRTERAQADIELQ